MRLVTMCVLVFSTFLFPPQAEPLSELWADSTTDASGAVSGAGHLLPHVDWTTCDLAVRNLQSRVSRALGVNKACSQGYPLRPTLSPEGTEIAYGFGSSIFVIPAAGGQPRVVAHDDGLRVQAWRVSNEKELIVTKAKDARDAEIGVITLETGAYRPLVSSARGAQNMSVSADGQFLAYERWQASNPALREVRVVAIQTGRAVPLTLTGDTYSPVWAPTGDRLLFLKANDRSRDLSGVSISKAGKPGEPTLVRSFSIDATLLGFDGAKNLLIRDEAPSRVTRLGKIEWPSGTVELMSTLEVPPLTEPVRATFSLQGDKIAFQLRSGSAIVRPGWATPAVKAVSGGSIRTYPTQLTIRDEAVWLPDGSGMIVVHDEAGQGEGAGPAWSFWRLDLASGKYERLGVAAGQGLVRLAGV